MADPSTVAQTLLNSRPADTTVEFPAQKQVTIIALPDEHYDRIRKMVRKNKGATVLRDNKGVVSTFFIIDGKLKARIADGELQDVIKLSEATKPSDDELKMRELVLSKNPDSSEEATTAAVDILMEGVRTAKRLVELGVPFDKARQMVGIALTDESGNPEIFTQFLQQTQVHPQTHNLPAEEQSEP